MLKLHVILLSTILLFTNYSLLSAQEMGNLRGFVTDSTSGEALVYANILFENTRIGVATDLNGFFSISSIPAGSYRISISFMGYKQANIPVLIEAGKTKQIRVKLIPSSYQLQTIEKVGERVRDSEKYIGLTRISVKELELMPKGVEPDVMRTLQFMPGVQSTGDVSARYYVRGGSSDQNMVLLNGVSVYNPFHAMGLFSIIDPEMINAMEFYKGGFAAEFGGRLSSVLNLVTKNGNRNRFAGSGSISFLTGKASLEGPIPGGSFILTTRKSLFDNILKKYLNYKDAPFEFFDYSFKANYSPNSELRHTRINVFAFGSNDQLKNNGVLNEEYEWSNSIYSANWFQVWESPIYSEFALSTSNFSGKVIPVNDKALARTNNVNDLTFKMDLTYLFTTKDELKIGFSVKTIKTDLYLENLYNTNTSIDDFAASINLYSKYRFLRFEDFTGEAGLRLNPASLSENNHFFEPRINTIYRLSPLISFKTAWGIYSQEMVALSSENEVISVFEPWLIVPDYLTTPSAIHYAAGADINLSANINLNVEAYYKILKDVIELNNKKYSSEDPDLIAGSGESYGWEFQLKISDLYGFNLLGSYSLSWAYKDVKGWRYYPRYDSRHSGKLTMNYDIGKDWFAGVNFVISSGLPFTQMEGFYDKLGIDQFNNSWFIYETYNPFTILSSKNFGRLPFYHRLDLNISKKLKILYSTFHLSFDIINVYDRKNIFYFDRKTGNRVNMLPFLPTASIRMEI